MLHNGAAIEQGVVEALSKSEVELRTMLHCFDHVNVVNALSLKARYGGASKIITDTSHMRFPSCTQERVHVFSLVECCAKVRQWSSCCAACILVPQHACDPAAGLGHGFREPDA